VTPDRAMTSPLITKSTYLKGRQCAKRLWLASRKIAEPELESEDVWEERQLEGAEVERFAERLFPGGVSIEEGGSGSTIWNELLRRTKDALDGNAPIFQAHLQAGDLFAAVDILEPKDGGWFLWEVKASTYKRDEWAHVIDWDLGFQVNAARERGLTIVGAGVLMLNRDFVRGPNSIKADELIVRVDRTEVVEGLLPTVVGELKSMRKALALPTVPLELPGSRCKAGRMSKDGRRASACGHIDASGECGRLLPPYWAGRLPRLTGAKETYVSGIPNLPIEQLDPDDPVHRWTPHQLWVIEAVQSGEPYIDKPALRDALAHVEWPVAYIDFEFDPGVAVPRFEGCRPYDRIPFQWALVVQPAPGAPLDEPQAFLHLDETDPSRAFAESLLAALPETGSLVAHHASAETSVLNRLAERLGGELGDSLRALCSRFQDTEAISKAGYYHPDQQGSWSIKKLAPALIGQGYDDLEIGNGMAAVMAWRKAIASDVVGKERERIRGELLEYCGRDAELMHGILEELRKLVATG